MTYYERPLQLQQTIQSLLRQKSTSFQISEIIIVDDSSKKFPLKEVILPECNVQIVKLVHRKKSSIINPCMAYNFGFKHAKGEIVLIQNSECLHYTSTLDYIAENQTESNYLSLSCYSLNKTETFEQDNLNRQIDFLQQSVSSDGQMGWYNHPTHRPTGYHFAASLYRHQLNKLGGFDPRFKTGFAYDDDEFLIRIKRSGLEVHIPKNQIVLHQWHEAAGQIANKNILQKKNFFLLNEVSKKETSYKPSFFSFLYLQFLIKWWTYLYLDGHIREFTTKQISQNLSLENRESTILVEDPLQKISHTRLNPLTPYLFQIYFKDSLFPLNELDSKKVSTQSLGKKMQLNFNFNIEFASSSVQLRLDLLKPYKASVDILKITFIGKNSIPTDLNLDKLQSNVSVKNNNTAAQLLGSNIEIYFNNPIKNFNQIKIEIQINEVV